MGKGDKRSRKGKIFAGSFGKTRKKHKKPTVPTADTAEHRRNLYVRLRRKLNSFDLRPSTAASIDVN